MITESRYDSRGLVIFDNKDVWNSSNPTAAMVVVPNASVENQIANTYDGAGRVSVSTFQTALQPKWSTTTRYGGDTVTVLPPAGAAATATVTDAKGQVVERREYNGNAATGTPIATQYTYDPAGRMTRMTGAGGVWTYDYDLRGRKISSSDPDSGMTTSTYDEADRLTSTTDSENNKLITTMDALDRKTGLFESSTADADLQAAWTYDEPGLYGQLSVATRFTAGRGGPAYKSIVMTRNGLYKPATISTVIPAAEGPELEGSYYSSISYAQDQQAVVGSTDSGGGGLAPEEIKLSLSPLGLPTKMVGGQTYVAEATYSVLGQVNILDIGANHDFPIENTWEAGTGRLLQSTAGESVYAANHLYTYDPAGNVTRDQDAAAQDTQCFDYDGHRRLTEAWTPTGSDCSATPSVNALGGPAPYWQSWTYTANGLRKTQVDHSMAGDKTSTYTYGTSQPHTLATVSSTVAGSTSDKDYLYDNRGNTTSRPDDDGAQTLEWNAEGKLSKLSKTTTNTEYLYDAEGQLLLRRNPTETTLYLGNLELVLNEATRKVLGKRQYSFAGSPIAARSANGTATSDLSWLVTDYHQTSQVAVAAGTLVATKRFAKPFGDPRGSVPLNWPSDRNFLNKPEDKVTGLTSVGAREYDPSVGRFISIDPLLDVEDPHQMLGFAYANNNPVSMSDPTGLINECDSCGGRGEVSEPPPPDVPDPDDEQESGSSRRGGNISIDHDAAVASTAVSVTAWAAQRRLKGHVTTDLGFGFGRSANTIPGAGRDGKGGYGIADVIFWGENEVYIWEIKPGNDGGRRNGRPQVNRYVSELQKKLDAEHAGKSVLLGPSLPRNSVPMTGYTLGVWSEAGQRGLRLYGRDKPRGKPEPEPVRVPQGVTVERRLPEVDRGALAEGVAAGVIVIGGLILSPVLAAN